MSNYQKQVEDFNNNYSSVIHKDVIDLSETFDKLFDEKNSSQILPTIEKARKMLSQNYSIPTKMQISYDIANGYHDYRKITGAKDSTYLEKEIYFLRNTLDMYEGSCYDEEDSGENEEIAVAKKADFDFKG